MASFPALRSGQVTMYGATRERVYSTKVVRFVNDTEQRWAETAGLARFILTFTHIDGWDLANVLEFFRSNKGRFDSTWDITLAGVTYSYMAFDQDEFVWSETKPNRFSATLRLVQVRAN